MQINSSVAGGPKPTPRSLGEGRLVLIIPLREQTGTAYGKKDEPKQEMVCDLVVLPDPFRPATPVIFGGKARPDGTMETPDTHRVDVGPQGWHVPNVIFSSGGMIWTLRRVLEQTAVTGQQQAIVGRLWRDHSPEARGAWKIAGEGHEATPQEIEVAAQWYAAMSTGQFTNSVAVPLNPIPQQAPQGFSPYGQQVGLTPAGYQVAQQAQQVSAPQYAPQQAAPQAGYNPQGYQQQAPASTPPQQPQGAMPYGQPQYAPQAQQQYVPAPVPQSAPPAAGPDLSVAPQGVEAETWARWDENSRRGFYAHAAAQGHPAAPAGMGAPTGY